VTRSTEAALPDTHVHYLPSAHVGDEFRIVVGSCEGAPAGAGVLVVLDAFYFFGTALETVRLLAMSGHIEPLLVVGVGYRPLTIADTTRLRQRDFTSVVDARAPGDPGMPPGADRFAAFLEEELEPCILARHDVADDGLGVLGYSQGGLFATHLLLTRPSAFRRYGIGSPSYWYGPRVIFETEERYASAHGDLPARVYVSIGEYENPAGDDRRREQMSPEAREASLRAEAEFPMEDEVGYARDLVERLQARRYPNLDITFEVLPGEYHPTAPPVTISRAVRHLYDAPR
jgi:predicted alpha/beta superfamily hydrolase